ncbi:MAG: YciI-like protein [Steroidobacteraceae bacterium]
MAEHARMHFLLFYDYVPDVLERRGPLRAAHVALAQAAQQRGELILGGALADPVDSAVLLFDCESASVVEQFVRDDPYVQGGLVTRWRIRPWTTVVGEAANTRV